jgi:uncharacterized protein (TIGR00299 family) protein
MRIAYLEGFSGISGDMLLGAFVSAGVSTDLLHDMTEALKLGAHLDIRPVDRSGIQSVKVDVLVGGNPAEPDHAHGHSHEHSHDHGHDHGHAHHDHGHSHPHAHTSHNHGKARSLAAIRTLIQAASLPEPVKKTSIRAFELLGASEAKIHNKPVESIHFHEVGSIDAIVDIVLAATAAHALRVDAWHCSPLNVGGGTVECAHGRFPVPAPATADLLLGAPTYSSGIQMELVTPTGAALVRALGCSFGHAPAMRVEKIGYGAGGKNPPGFANVLRLSVGESDAAAASFSETICVLETAIDDMNPQLVAHAAERSLQLGALDAMCQPVQMKKGRNGTLLTLLCDRKDVARLEQFLFRETSTLGVRLREERRSTLARRHVPVETEWGTIRIKVGAWQGRDLNAAAEFEDCRAAAERHDVPVKQVMETALQKYRSGTSAL